MIRSISAPCLRVLCLTTVSLVFAACSWGQSSSHAQNAPSVAATTNAPTPVVGQAIDPNHGSQGCTLAASQSDACLSEDVNGVSYQIAYRKQNTGFQITAVRTMDSRFVSPEGLKIDDVIVIGKPEDLILAPHVAVYANRGQLWVPIIGMLDNIDVVDADGNDQITPANSVAFNGKEIRVRIFGFVQRNGVKANASAASTPAL